MQSKCKCNKTMFIVTTCTLIIYRNRLDSSPNCLGLLILHIMHLLHGKQQIIDEQQVTKVIFKCLTFIAMFGFFFFSKCQIRNAIKSASTSGQVFVRGEVTRHRVLLNQKKKQSYYKHKKYHQKNMFCHTFNYISKTQFYIYSLHDM